jgi:hypothetical protein
MLPVTIIPRAVGAVGAVGTVAVGAGTLEVGAARMIGRLAFGAATSTGSLAVGAARSGMAGISMLNPVKWGAKEEPSYVEEGYVSNLTNGDTDGSDYMTAAKEYHAGAWIEEQEEVDWGDEKRRSLPATALPTKTKMSAFDTQSMTSTIRLQEQARLLRLSVRSWVTRAYLPWIYSYPSMSLSNSFMLPEIP